MLNITNITKVPQPRKYGTLLLNYNIEGQDLLRVHKIRYFTEGDRLFFEWPGTRELLNISYNITLAKVLRNTNCTDWRDGHTKFDHGSNNYKCTFVSELLLMMIMHTRRLGMAWPVREGNVDHYNNLEAYIRQMFTLAKEG